MCSLDARCCKILPTGQLNHKGITLNPHVNSLMCPQAEADSQGKKHMTAKQRR